MSNQQGIQIENGQAKGVPASEDAPVARHFERGLQTVDVRGRTFARTHLTVTAADGEDFDTLFQRMLEAVEKRGARLLWLDVIGRGDFYETGMKTLADAPEPLPVTWIDSDRSEVQSPLTLQAEAIAGVEVNPVYVDGHLVGNAFEDKNAKYCYLGGLRGPDLSKSRPEQARHVYHAIRTALGSLGMEFADVVRTWLYLDRLLEWYDDFNDVRTSFYRMSGVLGHMLPASTGVGTGIPGGGAVIAKALAIRPKTHRFRTFDTPSPLQCPAFDYASAFSRAVEADDGELRTLYVSGTASIEPGGRSMNLGDMTRQIELTMGVLKQLLKSRGMDWSDVTRAVAYFKDLSLAPHLEKYLAAHDIPPLPIAPLQSEVCREELLFEFEIDAVSGE